MQDDFRPPERQVFTPQPGDGAAQQPANEPAPSIDTQRIEQTFGPPADGSSFDHRASSAKSKKAKIMGLLPAVIPRRGKPSKRKLAILGAAGAVIVVAAGFGAYTFYGHYKPFIDTVIIGKVRKPAPKKVPNTLTGRLVDASVNNRPVTAVMIENSDAARPQSGLDQAGVVFEANAEGGVTRFLALFQDTQPDYIGPVRSARPYFIEWMLGFDAAYAHVGGSPDALHDVSSWHVKDLNQFYNAGAYQRITSRYAPHNVYTSIAQLNALEKSKGFTSHFTGFARKDKETPAAKPAVTSIDMTLSYADFNTHYSYDAKNNQYKRNEGGAPHMELLKGGKQVQITPKIVIAMIVPLTRGALDATGAYYSDYAVIGHGKVYVFQDGTVATGTWAKTSRTAQITFTGADGKPLLLDPGQTWIAALAHSSDVSYK